MSAGTVDANGATNAPPASPLNSTSTKKKVTSNSYEISSSTSTLLQAAGGIKHLSAAVFVAQQFDGKGADRKAVPRTPEQLQKLRRIVQSALGITVLCLYVLVINRLLWRRLYALSATRFKLEG